MTNTTAPTSHRRFPRFVWIILIVLVLILALVIWNSTRGGNSTTDNSAPPTSSTSPSASAGDGTQTPGARIDSTQRSWPDPSGVIDDTQYSTPGQYSVDIPYSRPVLTPVNHDGDLPEKGSLTSGMDKCSTEGISLEGKTTQQYVNARFLAVNEKSGPTSMSDDVPSGYAHTPQGGIIAALNQIGYGLYTVGDEVGNSIDEKMWATSDWVKELKKKGPDTTNDRDSQDISRSFQLSAPWGYKVVTCTENIMVVDVLTKEPDGMPATRSEGNFASKITMRWNNGDWTPDFTGNGDADVKSSRTISNDEVDSYTAVIFS